MLNDGKWYKVATTFVEEINNYYGRAQLSENEEFPPYGQVTEEQYNIEASRDNNRCNMDRKLISYGGNQIEFCDLYSLNKKFIHIKKYTGSAVLSHLFFQGLVSAECFFNKDFRMLVNQKMDQLNYDVRFHVEETDRIDTHNYEVIFAIAKKEGVVNGIKPNIPFFSKVSFKTVSSRLLNYGYNVSLSFLPLSEDE